MHSHFSCEMPCQGHITSKFSLCIDTWYKSGYINLSYFARDWVFEGQWILRWKLSLCITQQHSVVGAKLYIPSTLNIDLILWHSQLIVCAGNVKSWFKSWVFPFHFKLISCPIHWIVRVLAYLNFIFEF